jgi:hypothetical protein
MKIAECLGERGVVAFMVVNIYWLSNSQIAAIEQAPDWDEAERRVCLVFPNAYFAPLSFPHNDPVASTVAGQRFAYGWESRRDQNIGKPPLALLAQ